MIDEMLTEHQYMFLSSPPEKEAKFQQLKKEKGKNLAGKWWVKFF